MRHRSHQTLVAGSQSPVTQAEHVCSDISQRGGPILSQPRHACFVQHRIGDGGSVVRDSIFTFRGTFVFHVAPNDDVAITVPDASPRAAQELTGAMLSPIPVRIPKHCLAPCQEPTPAFVLSPENNGKDSLPQRPSLQQTPSLRFRNASLSNSPFRKLSLLRTARTSARLRQY